MLSKTASLNYGAVCYDRKMNKHDQINALANQIRENNVCPDLAEQATQLVIGSGSLEADIMIIGEAPGREEDELGVPFVGSAGKFLDKMLAEAGMSRDEVYITNIVKYRPPNNRDPSPTEKAEFWPYLIEQIEIIQPKVILTLGRHSGKAFLPGLEISRDHGQIHQVELNNTNYTIIPLYHPAAALYNGGLRQTLVDDFLKTLNYTEGL